MAAPLPELRPGTTLSDRYRLESHLGAGATSSVWRARDLELGRVVALKALLGSGVEPELADRFEREGVILGRLSHPNLVPVFASGSDCGRPYLVMELVDGVSFEQILADGPLAVDEALDVIADVAAGLGAAHRAGIVHRDLKPANIVCHKDGRPRLVDFGIARVSDLTTTTKVNTVIGSAAYLSPEQARGENPGPASDVYGLGCVLYQALTGRPPFMADSDVAVAYRHVHDEPAPPRVLRPDLPAHVDSIVLRALAKHPDERYPSAVEFEADLRRARAGDPPDEHRTAAAAATMATVAVPSATVSDTMPMPAVDAGAGTSELIDPLPLAERAPGGSRRWGIAAAVTAGVMVLGLLLAGATGGGGGPERPAGATDDLPVTTTVPTTEAPLPDPPEGDDAEPGNGRSKENGKKKGKGDKN